MSHDILLSDQLFKRLQSHAIPLVDTIETVIVRILDNYEGNQTKSPSGDFKTFDPASPPNLGHTTVIAAKVAGVTLKPSDTYWNNIMVTVIREMAKKGMTADAIQATVLTNSVVGEKTDQGYKYIPEAGISIQGLDANSAWKATHWLCVVSNIEVEVKFRWQNKEGVEMPGMLGSFIIASAPPKAA